MSEAFWPAMALTAIGTLLIRLLPLLWMQRRMALRQDDSVEALPAWLGVLAPMMIAAMLGVSLIPTTSTPVTWLATFFGATTTLLAWRRLRSLGWPVVSGVLMYGAVILLAGLFS
ncbi:AzlD domain-containing protein [Halomonas huangheensis]|uniref:Branched-chain amino acid ABC transporter n=1 Tax=Halomonas huangheensis TaxID=1178482 RepID=W1N767_9GAMM|nr:AzlD domain-containing protein [Halomonas huangheensis]ALM53089.1 branched-chain amino acid ABC transporter [Halomonas huangheensis]ERL51344.1 hypothetical protein BJB45_14225 [Halomonas huangheensis]